MRTAHRLELTGQKFGRLLVLERVGRENTSHHILWRCRCDCDGRLIDVRAQSLKSGNTQSCGCLYNETRDGNFIHGESIWPQTPEFRAWRHIIERITNPNTKQFADYGGRGITICQRWHDYKNFIADVGRRPSPNHAADRINNDGNYEPENFRWATRSQSNKNRRPRGTGSKANAKPG